MRVWRMLLIAVLSLTLLTGCESIVDTVHRIRYGNDRVSYHGRHYLNPRVKSSNELDTNGEKLIPTGEKVIGLPVYSTQSSLDFEKKNNVVPTVLILKEADDKYAEYALSGGP